MSDSSPSLKAQSGKESESDVESSRTDEKRFIRQSTGRPVVITKPPLARFDSVDIDAPLASKSTAHARKLQNRDPNAPSHFALRDKDTDRPSDDAAQEQAHGGTAIGSGGKQKLDVPNSDDARKPMRQHSVQSEKWGSFAAATQFRKRLDDYLRGEHHADEEKAEEKSNGDPEKRHHHLLHLDGLRRHDSATVTMNQQLTPAWNQPWAPHRRSDSDPFNHIGPSEGPDRTIAGQQKVQGFVNSVVDSLIYSVWAPVFLRLLNMAFTATLIGVAAKIQSVEEANNIVGIMGESTILALVVGSLTLIHVFVAIYLEYFGPPIGIWRMRTKMTHTLAELIFISMWSALLSLAFDDYFTTQATCTEWTPNARWRPMFGDSNLNGSAEDRVCDLQAVLVAMVFVGLILYQAVLVISLFRIFSKISRK